MSLQKPLLLELSNPKTKEIAVTITSVTSQKILDLLSQTPTTQTQLAKELHMPLTTIHYHIQKLQECGLIESKGYTYSTKGKEIHQYQTANRCIIIVPSSQSTTVSQQLLQILSVVTGIAFIGWRLHKPAIVSSPYQATETMNTALSLGVQPVSVLTTVPVEWYFIAGGVTAIVLFSLVTLLIHNFKRFRSLH